MLAETALSLTGMSGGGILSAATLEEVSGTIRRFGGLFLLRFLLV
jgi:hypothetical protein